MTEYTPQLAAEAHRTRPNYAAVFTVLALITLFEVTVATQWPAVLVVLSLTKVVLVAMYYMHLRFASGWFTAIFVMPIPFMLLVVTVVVVALAPTPEGVAATGFCSVW